MKPDYSNLQKIHPESILNSKSKILLTLALIMNDFSDLVYLQRLQAETYKDIDFNKLSQNGRYNGKTLYMFRLALSHFYAFLEFLKLNDKEITEDNELGKVIEKLSENDIKLWRDFRLLANNISTKNKDKTAQLLVKEDIFKLLKLSEKARHNLIYHYYHSNHFLKEGIRIAYIDSDKNFSNEFAFVTQTGDIHIDRSYYIDLAVQSYLEKSVGLTKSLLEVEKDFVDLLAFANRIVSKIVLTYHSDLYILEENNKVK